MEISAKIDSLMAQSATADSSETSPFRAGVVLRRKLFEQLSGAGRVTEVSAPAGSGKTYLLRSWIQRSGHRGERRLGFGTAR
jgi:ATP/maltotriose-dependent transcriptional regulator MalT